MAGQRLVVGLVRGLHGLAGAVRVEILTDDEARFQPGSVLHVEGSARRLTVAWAQEDQPGLLVRFGEIRSRTGAEALRDHYLEADAAASPPGEDAAAVWWHEVVGTPVTTTTGEPLGEVVDVFRAGGGEVYVVQGGERGEVLVPAVRDVVTEFAPREGRIVVDPGVLDLPEARARRPRGRRSSRAGVPYSAPRPGSTDREGGEAPDPSAPPGPDPGPDPGA